MTPPDLRSADRVAAAPAFRAALRRIERRLLLLDLLRGGAVGGLAAALLLPVVAFTANGGSLSPAAGTVVVALAAALGAGVGVLVGRSRRGTGPVAAARVVEAREPRSRNLVLTAAELLGAPGRAPAAPGVLEAVIEDAAELSRTLVPARLLPALRSGLAGAGALLLAAAILVLLAPRGDDGSSALARSVAAALPGAGVPDGVLELTVVPPAWIGGAAETHRDPERIQALEGSRIEVRVLSPVARMTLETVEGDVSLERVAGAEGEASTFTGRFTALDDGFLSFEGGGEEGPRYRRLVGLDVVPDERPRVRITAPGRDLHFARADSVLEVVVEATDDHALESMELIYTRVSGFGELFDFVEGQLPLEITRHGPRHWTGRAVWPLADLELDRGEMVVYHARASDRRPGVPPGESDTWMIQVLGGDPAASGGFAGEEDLDRYALSQQMVIVLTQRLQARRDSISSDEFAREVEVLSAAQRRVRAEFIFMLGGHLADDHEHDLNDLLAGDPDDHDHDHGHDPDPTLPPDPVVDPDARTPEELHEEAHARSDLEALEGRLEQQGRQELVRATQAMSIAVTFLNDANLGQALVAEELALEHLKRAFATSRYILRALPEREELDPNRRLTGSTAAAIRDVRPGVRADEEPGQGALRRALAEVAALAGGVGGASGGDAPAREAAERAHRIASSVLAVAAADVTLRQVAAHLTTAADALEREDARRALDALQDAADGLVDRLRGTSGTVPAPVRPPELRLLDGARAGGGGR